MTALIGNPSRACMALGERVVSCPHLTDDGFCLRHGGCLRTPDSQPTDSASSDQRREVGG